MLVGIDASRANEDEKTGVGWYAFFVIEGLKRIEHGTPVPEQSSVRGKAWNMELPISFVLYTREPLKGELARLPENWTQKVLKWPLKRFWTQIRLSWEMLANPPDILFIPAHVFPIIHPKKTVMTVHDIAALRFPESYNWFERLYTIWSAKHAVRKLWKVIVPSEFVRRELASLCRGQVSTCPYSSEKIMVIPHGYDVRYKRYEMGDKYFENISPATSAGREILKKYCVERPFVLSVGRLEEKKNTARIVEAFEKCRDAQQCVPTRLVLIGLKGHGYEKAKKAIEASEFKSDILELGYVDENDLPYIMNAAEVFVFPSLYEGFGLSILEAMACGVPVVASRGSALEEVGGDACLYVDPFNTEEIAETIKRLLNDQPLRARLIERGLNRAREYSWEKSARLAWEALIG